MLPSDKPIGETSPYLPTLSTKGWVSGMYEKIDLIFSYYLLSQYNQTVYHLTHVKSLQYRVKEHGSDPANLADAVKSDIEKLLKPYIDHVDVRVTYEQRGETTFWDYTISLELIHQGYRWEQWKALTLKDGKFEALNELNRSGEYAALV